MTSRWQHIWETACLFLHNCRCSKTHYTVYDRMSKGVLAAQSAGRRRRGGHSKTTQLAIASLCLFFALFALRTNAHANEDEWKREKYFGEKVIAIHLGASESRVGVIENNQVHNLGSVPSYVSSTNAGLVAGDEAKKLGGPNLLTAAMDMMSHFADESPGSALYDRPGDMFSYSMQKGHQTLQVSLDGTNSSFTPTDIFAPILANMRSIAQSYLGSGINITGAVVALPLPYGYNGMNTVDSFVYNIRTAGDMVNLPIIRTMREATSIAIALGLDVLSETDGERYAVIYDLADDFDTLTVTVLEIEDGVFDTLSIHRVYNVSEASYPDRDSSGLADTGNGAVLDFLDDLTLENPILENKEAKTSHAQEKPCLTSNVQISSVHAIHNALTKARLSATQITDLIFTPASKSFPGLQGRVAGWFNKTARIANSDNLNEAALWGAALMSSYMAEDDWWVGSSCSTSRPGVAISTTDGSVVEIIPGAQSLPSFGKQAFMASCRNRDLEHNTTTMKVYLREIPAIDYHAKFELGDQYVFDPTPEDIFLAEFSLNITCESRKSSRPPAIEVSAFVSRNAVLYVQATNKGSGESKGLRFADASTHCGQDERNSPRNFTSTLLESLEMEYEIDLRRLVGPSNDQKPVEAFGRALFSSS
ncbi:Hsp70 protein-domain-containing protein [Aspergillus foveolatus]|uniref:Hsp70 protein-domain-containing protein n=1 Tax=Aspergillus foveolatus TaxID=210207 RepID=UPI003CCD2FA0